MGQKKRENKKVGVMTNDNTSVPTSSHSLLPPFHLPLSPSPILPHSKTMFDLSPQKPDRIPAFLTENYGAMNIGVVRTQGTVQNFGNFKAFNGRNPKFGDEEAESGVRTPPLWPGSPPRRPNNYRCLSPTSKAQAIARGQKELMDMVSKIPESCYELSLRDLVEQPMMLEAKSEKSAEIAEKKMKKKEQKKGQISRSRSIDNGGFLLKMMFPVSLGSKKKKKKSVMNMNTNTNSRVSPKPSGSESSTTKVEDKIWWKNRFAGSSESDCGGLSVNSRSTKSSRSSSSNSTSSNRSSSRHGMVGGCCGIIRTKESEGEE